MKAFISLAVAPDACEYRLFPSLLFSTEGSQILWVTKPLHSEGCHSFFFSLIAFSLFPSLQHEHVLRMSLWRFSLETGLMNALWLSQQEALVVWTSITFLPSTATLSCAPLPSSSCNIAIQPVSGIKDQRSLWKWCLYLCIVEQIVATHCLPTLSSFSIQGFLFGALIFTPVTQIWFVCLYYSAFYVKNNSSLCTPVHSGASAS